MSTPPTLPDLLREGLDVVFVGINPSVYSAGRGHYFARRANRFWPAFSRSRLSLAVRQATGLAALEPVHDRALLEYGFGFTDVAKRPTPRASDLTPREFAAGVDDLVAKLNRYKPALACFHGVMGYRHVHRIIAPADAVLALGLQATMLGCTRLFVVPNPSPANAHYTPADQADWYDRLADCTARVDAR